MDKKLLFLVVLSISTFWLLNYFGKKDPSQQNLQNLQRGQGYTVPLMEDLARPIELEIDFLDKKIIQKEEEKSIETDFCKVSFSNYGGVISGLEFKKFLGRNSIPLETIQNKGFYSREEAAFLLALEEMTPYFYKFEKSIVDDDKLSVVYSTKASGWNIKKIYNFYKHNYKVDLKIKFEKGAKATSIRPRLFFPAPFVNEVDDNSLVGIVGSLDNKSTQKVASRDLSQAWVAPSLLGAQDKYFVHSFISDVNGNFVNRGFFKEVNNKLFTVLEGKEIAETTSIKLSFYLGPKKIEDISVVDSRLEGVLDFGWLSWLCKLLLKLLEYLYSMFNNFGVAIIVLAIVLKLPFLPLSIAGRRKMEEYQRYTPTINRIRQKYKKDSVTLNAELMKFHKDHGISPVTNFTAGCLPLLIQMPIMFALYRILVNYIELYQAPFCCWITNLSAKDPYYVLPLLMAATMFIQQSLTKTEMGSQKAIMFFMPLVMLAIFIKFPAGLVLYWMVNNILTIGEELLRKKLFN